jgi:hypothetical protein
MATTKLGRLAKAWVMAAVAFTMADAAAQAPAGDGRFEAFSWVHVPNSLCRWSSANVTTMVEIAPWTSIPEAARQLNALPAGNRWVMLFIVTDDMANHPKDRCIRESVELRTSYVSSEPVVRAPSQPKATSAGRVRNPATPKTAPTLVPVTKRVVVRTVTPFRGPWMEHGVAETRNRIAVIMNGLKAAGAQVDGVIVDNETTLDATHFMGKPGSLSAIQSDPRWPALARELGLPAVVTGMSWGSPLYFAWTKAMASRFDKALNDAVYGPIRAAFPKATVSNYCSGNIAASHAWPDINGHVDVRTTAGFGSHDSHEFYGWMAPGRLGKVTVGTAESPQWVSLRLEVFKIRGMAASSSRPKHAWIGAKSWVGEAWGPVSLREHAMWDELIIQLAMNGIEDFLHFSPYLPTDPWSPTAAFTGQLERDHRALDIVLGEVNRIVGTASGRTLISAQPSWGEKVIASGLRVGDEIVWRFSFEQGVDSVVVELSDGSTARIVREPGRCGAWFRHGASLSLLTDGAGKPKVRFGPEPVQEDQPQAVALAK